MRYLIGSLLFAIVVAVAANSGCYGPSTPDGAFTCTPDLGGACPQGLQCSTGGICVHALGKDMDGNPLDLAGDQAQPVLARTCDDKILAGAFTGFTALAALNTAADEAHLAFDLKAGAPRLLFQRGNQLFASTISTSSPTTVAAPQAVTLTPSPAVLSGGNFTSDGHYWFAGSAGATSTALFEATPVNATSFTVGAAHAPQGSCPFSDPFFMQGDSTFQMYAGYALGGCGGQSYVVRSALDRNVGAFYSALPDSGWGAPSMTPTGLLLIVSSTLGGRHLYASRRDDFQFQFTTASRIPMSAIGESTEDRQAVVNADCSAIYFSSVRTGGAGGADIYAALIEAQ